MKLALKTFLYFTGISKLVVRFKMNLGKKIILNYHHILPDVELSQNMFYGYSHSTSSFNAQIKLLADQFEFALDLDDPSKISITLDDGSKSIPSYVTPGLNQYNIQAWFFINDLEETEIFWFDRWYLWFSYAPNGTYKFGKRSFSLSNERDRVTVSNYLFEHLVEDYSKKDELLAGLFEQFDPTPEDYASPERLRRISREEIQNLATLGHNISYHSKSHEILLGLSREKLIAEITPSDSISELLTHTNVIAIPFGFDGTYNDKVIDHCVELGYDQILLNTAIPNKENIYGRINLPNTSNAAEIYFALAFS